MCRSVLRIVLRARSDQGPRDGHHLGHRGTANPHARRLVLLEAATVTAAPRAAECHPGRGMCGAVLGLGTGLDTARGAGHSGSKML